MDQEAEQATGAFAPALQREETSLGQDAILRI